MALIRKPLLMLWAWNFEFNLIWSLFSFQTSPNFGTNSLCSPHIMPMFRLQFTLVQFHLQPDRPTLQSCLRAQRARQLLHFYNRAQLHFWKRTPTYLLPTTPVRQICSTPHPPPCTPSVSLRERDVYCLIASRRYICLLVPDRELQGPDCHRAARAKRKDLGRRFKRKLFERCFQQRTPLPPFGANMSMCICSYFWGK